MYSKGRDWLSVFYGEGLVECILTMGGTGQVYSHYGEGLVECTLTMMRDWLSVLSLWEGTG